MQIITEIEQGSPEWHALRLGIVTCSNLDALLVSGKGEAGFGAAAFSYMDQLIGERITGEAAEPPLQSRAIERGHELEPVARGLYEAREQVTTNPAAIILNHGIGYSPDGLVADHGLIEIKTKLPKYQVGVILGGEIPKEHVAQCQGGLWVSEREWIDFICYWPGMPLFIRRAVRDEPTIRKLAERVATFHEILDERMNRVLIAA
jgi:hypothetical protein